MPDLTTAEAKRSLKKLLLRYGGSAQIFIDNTQRILSHGLVSDRPLDRLPWPLSLLQPLSVTYTVWEVAEETLEQKLARLEDENKKLKEQIEQRRPGEFRQKVEEPVEVTTFSRWQINHAVAKFLDGVPPSIEVLFLPERWDSYYLDYPPEWQK